MKKILLYILLISSYAVSAQQYERITVGTSEIERVYAQNQLIWQRSSGNYWLFGGIDTVVTSSDGGATFDTLLFPGDTNDAEISYSGQYQFLAIENELLKSSNYGMTFDTIYQSINNNTKITDMSISADAQYILLAILNQGYVLSSDYGETWTETYDNKDYYAVSMSDDGRVQAYASGYDKVYVSRDYGETFNDTGINAWGVGVSGDGDIITIPSGRTAVYVSSNSGVSFSITLQNLEGLNVCEYVDLSYTGKVQAFSGKYIGTYISIDYGQSWTYYNEIESNSTSISPHVSKFGDYVYQCDINFKPHISTDFGATFTKIDLPLKQVFGYSINN